MENDNYYNMPEPEGSGMHNITPKIAPVGAAFLGLLSVFILYQIIGSLLSLAIFGMDMKNADVNALRWLTTSGQMLFILLPALVLSKWIYTDVTYIIRARLPKLGDVSVFSVGLILLVPMLQSYLYIQNYAIEKLATSNNTVSALKKFLDEFDKIVSQSYGSLLKSNSLFDSVAIIAMVAVVPALCEEVFFRGFVQKSFEFKLKPLFAILVTSVFFGLYHFNPYEIIPLVSLGCYFGYAVYKTNSIVVSMSLHFLNNLTAVIALFMFGTDELVNTTPVSASDLHFSVISFFASGALFALYLIFIEKYYKMKVKQ